eukprot:TRINITY_DN16625_c0_g1_i1.p1 TRINITY_DN16625_c0_g1~~TRINITY_DN16625_c0_g1_i1.p1  ORF type:complete len:142 (-),score=21.78 TRINITY_DN16625_c0_g1_i1:38-412(-)
MDTAFGALRIAVGAFSWLLPSTALVLFGVRDEKAPKPTEPDSMNLDVMTRMFGVRDLVLGAAVATASHPLTLRLALQMGLFVDCVDIVTFLLAHNRGFTTRGHILGTSGAFLFALYASYRLYFS